MGMTTIHKHTNNDRFVLQLYYLKATESSRLKKEEKYNFPLNASTKPWTFTEFGIIMNMNELEKLLLYSMLSWLCSSVSDNVRWVDTAFFFKNDQAQTKPLKKWVLNQNNLL